MNDEALTNEVAICGMIVSNPAGADRPEGWKRRVNDLMRAMRDEIIVLRGAADHPDRTVSVAMEVAAEVARAEAKHAPMQSPHEGWSVIFEELEELREHVRGDTGRSPEARKEALQVAAMGMRYALNLCEDTDA